MTWRQPQRPVQPSMQSRSMMQQPPPLMQQQPMRAGGGGGANRRMGGSNDSRSRQQQQQSSSRGGGMASSSSSSSNLGTKWKPELEKLCASLGLGDPVFKTANNGRKWMSTVVVGDKIR